MEKLSDKIKELVPPQSVKKLIEFSTINFAILKPRAIINEEVCLDSYHFVIPSSRIPPLKIDKNIYEMEINKIYPTNPEQVLSVITPCHNEVMEYTTIFIEKRYLRDIVRNLSGKSDIQFINGSYHFSVELIGLIRQFIHESQNRQFGYEFILQSLSDQISTVLLRQLNSNLKDKITDKIYSDKSNINRAIEYLYQCFSDNLSLAEVAKIANLSPFHFIRIFKMETGKTPYEYLMDIKIDKAKEMLNQKQYSITEISFLCGFTNPSHFASIFKKKTGLSPSAYSKMLF